MKLNAVIRKRILQVCSPVNQNRATRSVLHNIGVINRKTRPAVAFAFLRTLLNGWVTHGRMRKFDKSIPTTCVFQCSDRAYNSIQHYFNCPIVANAWAAVVPYIDFEPGVEACLMCGLRLPDDTIVQRARLNYACYSAFNTLRKSIHETLDPTGLMCEVFKHSSHKTLTKFLK